MDNRISERNRIKTRVRELESFIRFNTNAILRLRQGSSNIDFCKARIEKLKKDNDALEQELKELGDRQKKLASGELDQELSQQKRRETAIANKKTQEKRQKKLDELADKAKRSKISKEYWDKTLKAGREARYQERSSKRGYDYVLRVHQSLPQYIRANLANMPNNKGYIWRGIHYYGLKDPEKDQHLVMFENKKGELHIHELSNDYLTYVLTVKQKKQSLTLIFIFISGTVLSQNSHNHQNNSNLYQIDSLITSNPVDKNHALEFGSLVIQDSGGRMKPLNTFSSELLRKVSKSDSYKNLNSDQVMLSITKDPLLWYNIPIIYLKRGNDSLRKITGRSKNEKYAAFVDFFDENGNYKLAKFLERAYKSSLPNQFEKDFIETDRKVNLMYSALDGNILKIFPIPNDDNNKWVSFKELDINDLNGIDTLYVKNILPLYLGSLQKDIESNDYTNSKRILESIRGFQTKYGASILPSEDKIKAEILYNKYDIFRSLFSWYMYVGTLMFVFLIFQIFYNNKVLNYFISASKYVIFILFILQTLGLIARGFISGHAPWSDAYESIIFVAWATVIFGIIFGRKSYFTLASSTFVASIILSIANMNWLDPSIANLQPVLDSYWLMIHVAVIVGSYGPFAIGMILGIVTLFLTIIATKKNRKIFSRKLEELTIVNELSLTIGLVMLTIGNFLGGMWANESWGRYWGWDPKETWALISIMIYTAVLHLRIIPRLNNKWLFNLMSIISFAAIMMTYFGVNFYLVGLHSYASGDKVITPDFVYYSTVFVFILGLISYFANKKTKVL